MIIEPHEVSILIVTYNNQISIEYCLDSLVKLKRQHNIEIILVDNASADGTVMVVERYSGVDIIKNKENIGYCAANNQAIKRASDQFILLLNPDIVLTEDFLANALEVMGSHPNVALLTGKVLSMDNKAQPTLYEGRPIIDTVGMKMCRNRQTVIIGEGEIDNGQYDEEQHVFAVCGAVCLSRRSALEEAMIDGQVFDEKFFAYKEDLDLAWRLRKLGWSCYYTPNAVAYHARHWKRGLSNRSKIDSLRRYYSFKNRRLMILKNDTIREILPDIIHIFIFELLSLFYAIIFEQFLLRAYLDIIKEFPRIQKWRREIFKKQKAGRSLPPGLNSLDNQDQLQKRLE